MLAYNKIRIIISTCLSVLDLLLNLRDQSLQVSNFFLGHVILGLLKVADPGLEEVDGVPQALHSLVILSVEALSDPQLVVRLGNIPELEDITITINHDATCGVLPFKYSKNERHGF